MEAAGQGTDTVRASIRYELTDNVENLVLTGSAAINGIGNALNNRITGNQADNTLSGGLGADTMTGAGGDDTYYVDNAGDRVVEAAGNGVDTVRSTISHVLAANVDNLVLTGSANINGTGNSGANVITGNAGNNVLDGASGIDTLSYASVATALTVDSSSITAQVTGAGTDTLLNFEKIVGSAFDDHLSGTSGVNLIDGGKGADTMAGGAGDDTYLVDNAADQIVEAAQEGTDLVQSSVSYTLQAEVDNLTLTGSAHINGTGNRLANVLVGNAGNNVLTGGSGSDTYIVDNAGDQTIEQVGGGLDVVQSSVSWTLGGEVENLTLTGTEAINATGNIKNNVIVGNAGANVLDGGAGVDTMTGGAGGDTYVVDNAADVTVELAGGGLDTVRSSISLILQAEVENLVLTGTAALQATGNWKANAITGNGAANHIDGGTGADTMSGGARSDTYVVDEAGDRIVEQASSGLDSVLASVSRVLESNVENLTLTGFENIDATGNSLANLLTGNTNNNKLDGELGADTMKGGSGDDIFIVDNAGDQVAEAADGGVDMVQSSVNVTLAAQVEYLTLTGSSAINGIGNELDNWLVGNGAANNLQGGAGNDSSDGSAGQDVMTGGAGNDVYTVENVGDKVVEAAGGGNDMVHAWVSYTLSDEVETLSLAGVAAIDGTGNAGANTIIGNWANNVLDGSAGADRLVGDYGDDTYLVDNLADVIDEYGWTDIDSVQASVSWALGDNLENLTLTGSAAINATGNALANIVIGNSAANILNGGAGTDTLIGGAGNDVFNFTSAPASDTIIDFASGTDKARIGQVAIHVGDGDNVVEGAVSVTGPNEFAASAELVIVSHNIAGGITSTSAASAIGHANSAYTVGDTRLFVVDNGTDSAVYLFTASNADATIGANELTLVTTLQGTGSTGTGDYYFGY